MRFKKVILIISLTVFFTGFLFSLVFAEGPLFENPAKNFGTLEQLVSGVTSKISDIGILIAVAVIAYGGIKFMTAGGDPGKVTTARKLFTYGVIGVAVVISASTLVDAVLQFLGAEDKAAQPGQYDRLYNQFVNMVKYFYSIVFMLSMAFLAWAGLQYLTAKGDDQQITKAKKNTLYGIIGLGIILGVWIIILLVSNIIGVQAPNNPFANP